MGDEVLLGHRAEMVDVWDDGLQELDPIEEAPGDVRSTDRDLDLSALPGGVAEDDHGGRGRDQGLLTAVEADADRLGEPVQPQHPHPSRPGERKLLDIDGIAAELWARSEEHTSELQSRGHLVCRLLLEKKESVSGWWV